MMPLPTHGAGSILSYAQLLATITRTLAFGYMSENGMRSESYHNPMVSQVTQHLEPAVIFLIRSSPSV